MADNLTRKIVLETNACIELITKAPDRDAHFELLLDDLHEVMANTWDEEILATYRDLLEQLYNADITTGEQAEKMVSERLGEGFALKVDKPLQEWTSQTYKLGSDEVAARLKTEISLNLADRKAINVLNEQNIFWVGEYYDENSKSEVKNAMNKLLADGASRDTIAKELREVFNERGMKGSQYFYDFTNHVAGRLRNMGAVSAMRKSTAEYAEVVAILDDRTTDICREMNGRLVPVGTLVETYQSILDIKTEGRTPDQVRDDLKKIAPFWSDKNTAKIMGQSTGKIVGKNPGLALPPYHWRCRTRIFPVMQESLDEIPTIAMDQGKKASSKTKNYLKNLTNAELHNKLQPIIDGKDIRYDAIDLQDDFEKHGKAEFGFTTKREYSAFANKVRTNADLIQARVYKGDPDSLQFSLYSTEDRAYVVIDSNAMIKGCYGHLKSKDAILKAFNGQSRYHVILTMEKQ